VSASLYVRDGSRFVLYDERAQHTPPIPVPAVLDEPTAECPVVEVRPGKYRVYAPRCAHGHFAAVDGGRGRGCRPCGRR
jgi:hypothetical protein